MQVVLDDVQGSQAFSHPRRVIQALRSTEVPAALAAMETERAQGRWLAGWMGYELGYALEERLAPLMPVPSGPLLCFGVFDRPSGAPPRSKSRAYAGPLACEWDAAAYARAFEQVKRYIAAGDIYQANLSFRARFAFAGDPYALYTRLKTASTAPYCAFADFLDPASGRMRQILSLSPELFFDLAMDGALTAKPMKGTMALDQGAGALAASAKDRAENLMIVDLIRNDLGRIAQTGSVAVRDLFAVESYPTLHAMVSTVTARLQPGAGIADMVRALFPCGSVTGAPKIRAMEILRELEASPRGAYCGAIGFFAPANGPQGAAARFNVAIRTLTIDGNRGELGIGGGVVQDSLCDNEYAECLLKARFFEAGRRPLALIETLRHDGAFVRLDSHLARMAASARILARPFDDERARDALSRAVAGQDGVLRVRLTLDEMGQFHAIAAPLPPNPAHWTYAISSEPVDGADPLLRHKTNWREFYEGEAARYASDEVIFRNERGELTEGTRSNIFVRRGDKFLTPPLSCGVLDGRLRAELIGQGQCEEAVLTQADLNGEVFLGNSLRGLILAVAV